VLPLQSFPSSGSRARFRGSLLPCGFALRPSSGAAFPGASRSLSPPRRLESRDDGSSRSLSPVASTHPKVRRTCRPLPVNAGLAAYERHARFEALLPPRVRSVRPSPWQAKASRPVLSWGCRPPELSPSTTPGPVCRAGARAGLDTPATHVSGRPAFAVAGREPSTDPGFMNPGSVDAPRLRTGARYRRAVARAPSRRHPAPPCPSRHVPPPRGSRRWTSKTLAWDRLQRLRFFGVVVIRPSTGADRWWALLLPGEPSLVGFRPSSTARRFGPEARLSARPFR
jgi:hypothetical protein